jgi:hypothetical protein
VILLQVTEAMVIASRSNKVGDTPVNPKRGFKVEIPKAKVTWGVLFR